MTICSTFTTDSLYDNSTFSPIENVYGPNESFSEEQCIHKKTFQSLETCHYQCPQTESTIHMRCFPFEKHTFLFFLKCDQKIYFSEKTQYSIQNDIGDVFCSTCRNKNCVFLRTNKNSSKNACAKLRSLF